MQSTRQHLLGNLGLLVLVGCALERRHGGLRTCIIFLGAGWWAAAASVLVGRDLVLRHEPEGGGPLDASGTRLCSVNVGASAAIYGLVGALAGDVLQNSRTFEYPLLASTIIAAAVGGLAIGPTLTTVASHERVSTLSHFCGLMFGVFTGPFVLETDLLDLAPRKAACIAVRVFAMAFFCFAVIASPALALRPWSGAPVICRYNHAAVAFPRPLESRGGSI